ncbi:hypothetical protein VTJ49DRAFT_1896 [Mycothermus thermophilus]|uniref:Uncharacterized protein n=1 Tax=Humicola insolens TaxID=85995 RepID=A0ABR3VCF4_HUMIN
MIPPTPFRIAEIVAPLRPSAARWLVPPTAARGRRGHMDSSSFLEHDLVYESYFSSPWGN